MVPRHCLRKASDGTIPIGDSFVSGGPSYSSAVLCREKSQSEPELLSPFSRSSLVSASPNPPQHKRSWMLICRLVVAHDPRAIPYIPFPRSPRASRASGTANFGLQNALLEIVLRSLNY